MWIIAVQLHFLNRMHELLLYAAVGVILYRHIINKLYKLTFIFLFS